MNGTSRRAGWRSRRVVIGDPIRSPWAVHGSTRGLGAHPEDLDSRGMGVAVGGLAGGRLLLGEGIEGQPMRVRFLGPEPRAARAPGPWFQSEPVLWTRSLVPAHRSAGH